MELKDNKLRCRSSIRKGRKSPYIRRIKSSLRGLMEKTYNTESLTDSKRQK
jgi:hypothetical protein